MGGRAVCVTSTLVLLKDGNARIMESVWLMVILEPSASVIQAFLVTTVRKAAMIIVSVLFRTCVLRTWKESLLIIVLRMGLASICRTQIPQLHQDFVLSREMSPTSYANVKVETHVQYPDHATLRMSVLSLCHYQTDPLVTLYHGEYVVKVFANRAIMSDLHQPEHLFLHQHRRLLKMISILLLLLTSSIAQAIATVSILMVALMTWMIQLPTDVHLEDSVSTQLTLAVPHHLEASVYSKKQ
mmetsp:Transcript_3704/g.5446  ORF Transcript_3704/g.5446 Transcript_3704/m.5446 type:complete len:242 (-) Transcript_3704:154-879(-)